MVDIIKTFGKVTKVSDPKKKNRSERTKKAKKRKKVIELKKKLEWTKYRKKIPNK